MSQIRNKSRQERIISETNHVFYNEWRSVLQWADYNKKICEMRFPNCWTYQRTYVELLNVIDLVFWLWNWAELRTTILKQWCYWRKILLTVSLFFVSQPCQFWHDFIARAGFTALQHLVRQYMKMRTQTRFITHLIYKRDQIWTVL